MLTTILHTGIAVADIDASIALYQSLGYELTKQFDKPEPAAKVASLKLGDVGIELWQFADMSHPQVEFIRNHVAIYSDDLAADVDMLVRQGYKLVIPITEGVILRYAFVQDPAGTCYEIATEK
jgi:catechol 2,3-dioxygenase-like lactoylglutathione lyase family enzyme